MLLLPVGLNNVVPTGARLTTQQRNDFMRAFAIVKRSNQRLHDTHSTVVSAAIAPSFQIVRAVHMPLAKLGGFVLI